MGKLLTKYLEHNLQILGFAQLQLVQNEVSGELDHPAEVWASLIYLHSHTQTQYKILSCVSGLDYPQEKQRFYTVYEILSIKHNSRFRLKTSSSPSTSIDSVVNIYSAANWYEREILDFFGVFFKNHPDLRRILTDYGFQGYPLRKDFPLSGYVEVRYDDSLKRVVTEALETSKSI